MIPLLLGMLLVGVASGCSTALLRPRGTIAVALCFAVVAFAEVVVVSHGLSFFEAYERVWFLVTTAGARASWPRSLWRLSDHRHRRSGRARRSATCSATA